MEKYTKLSPEWNRSDIVFDKYGRLVNICSGTSYRDIAHNGSLLIFNDNKLPIINKNNNITIFDNIKKNIIKYDERYIDQNYEKKFIIN
jgi:hypothetical protein